MFPFNATPYYSPAGKSVEAATSTSVAVTYPTTPFTVPKIVRVVVTSQSVMSMANAPAPAVATDIMLIANLPEFVLLPAGMKIGVLADTAAGQVCFTPCE